MTPAEPLSIEFVSFFYEAENHLSLEKGMSATGVDQTAESTEKSQAPGSSSLIVRHVASTLSASFGIVGLRLTGHHYKAFTIK